MKILLVSHTYIVKEHHKKIETMVNKNIDVFLIVPKKWINRDINQKLEYVHEDVKKFKIKAVRTFFYSFGSLIFYSPIEVLKIVKEFNPDIIHIEEEPWSLACLEFCIIAWLFRKKFIFFTWENLDRFFILPFRLIRKIVLKLSDFALCGNQDASKIIRKYGYRGRIAIIPQIGVDENTFSPSGLENKKKDHFVIGYIGRFVKQKGIDLLLRAIYMLDNSNIKVLFVGTGPMEKEIINFSINYNMFNRIEILKFVPHNFLPKVLHNIDVLVLPSVSTSFWKEQFGHVLIEAMSFGIPVIGSTCGEIPNVISDCGLIFQEGSVNDLAEKIRILYQDRVLYNELKKKGRERVLKEYTHEKIAEKLKIIYENLLYYEL